MNLAKKEIKIILLVAGILLLLIGCSKNTNQKNAGENSGITASVIEVSKENCRLSNESDCSPIEMRRGEPEKEGANFSENKTEKKADIPEEFLNLNCTESWKCVESRHRAYQFSNCSWISIEYCIYGCNDGACKPVPVCRPNSLKCDKDNLLVCDSDGYDWKLNESCDYHCENGVCISKNLTINNITNSTNQTNSTNSTTDIHGHDLILDNCMRVLNFNYAPAGNNLSDEYFTLKNSCSYQIDMSGWTAKDNAEHAYTFPSFNLGNAAKVSVVTGSGIDNSTALYWGRSSAVWNNNVDTLYLNTSNGTSVLIYSYP